MLVKNDCRKVHEYMCFNVNEFMLLKLTTEYEGGGKKALMFGVCSDLSECICSSEQTGIKGAVTVLSLRTGMKTRFHTWRK